MLLNILQCLKLNIEECWSQCELLCMFKTLFSDLCSPQIPGNHRCLLAFIQRSSGAILATMGDYPRFLKLHRKLTRTSWCDGPITGIPYPLLI